MQKPGDGREYLAVKEVAHLLRLSPATVYRGIASGAVPAVRLHEHGALRVPRDFLQVSGVRQTSAGAR